jgi:peptidylprolyl isomerase
MKRLSLLALGATLFTACGDNESATKKQTQETEVPVTETEVPVTETEVPVTETVDKSDWPVIGDGIPEIDESGAITTESGLTIVAMKEGTGEAAGKGDLVAVHYHGWLASDGTQFDSSAKGGDPISFPLGAGMVIPGWDEGVASLKIGGKARLRIPYNLAYGENGRGPIPAKADLVFDVWLVGSFSAAKDGIPEIDESNAVTSPTGLVKIPLSEGTGQVVGSSTASVHYHGWLASDGTLFDSSARKGRPFSFPVGAGMVIPGWDEGVSEMKVGEKARFRIPYNLAYGDNGRGPIPAKADLVFDVWVMSAKSTPKGMPAGHP